MDFVAGLSEETFGGPAKRREESKGGHAILQEALDLRDGFPPGTPVLLNRSPLPET
ncbi:MAG: hypothetical protein Kow0040_24060 [Thermogutta sp.]